MVRRILVTAGLSASGIACLMGVVGCENAAPPAVFDVRALQQAERDSAQPMIPTTLPPLPTTREDPFATGGDTSAPATRPTTGPSLSESPITRLTLHEIIQRAVANNHDVRVAGYQPAIEGNRVIEAKAHFDPEVYANAKWSHTDDMNGGSIFNSFNNGPLIITDVTQSDTGVVQTGVKANLANGAQVQLQYETQYQWTNPQQYQSNPFYSSDLTLQITQPLLKNFGDDVNEARIVIARLTQKVSVLEFRKAVEQNAADIEKAYWQLAQAERDVQIEEDLVETTESEYSILNTRKNQGLDVGTLQVEQAATRLESRRAALLQYKAQARDLSDQLKGLMSDPDFPVTTDTLVLPADLPIEQPMSFNLSNEIDTAMENRFELGEQQLKVDSATVTVTVAKNNLLPQLDFVGSIGAGGAAADFGPAVIKNSDLNHLGWTFGFQASYFLGNREARAIWRRSLLERMQAIEQYRAIIENVAVDVMTSARAVSTAWDVIVDSRKARFHAEAALNSINEREKANEPLRPEFVELKLDTQEQLSNALHAEAQAVANYNIALAQLERAKGTLLRYNNVLLEEDEYQPDAKGYLH
jgi:outer membrane protein TolC